MWFGLTYSDAIKLVKAAKQRYPYLNDALHVIAKTNAIGLPYVEAHFPGKATGPVPSLVDSLFNVRVLKVKHLEHVPQAKPLCCDVVSGGPATAAGANVSGTAGWSLQLDSRRVCLSNWHVYLPQSANGSERVEFDTGSNSELGTVVDSSTKAVTCDGSTINQWDLAVAEFDNPKAPCASMLATSCQHGAYPTELAVDGCACGEPHRKVGAATDGTCGTLDGIGDLTITYPQGTAKFSEQLVFKIDALPGDSGSIAIRSKDNQVTGLLFAILSPGMIAANPLFRINWQQVGTTDGLPTFTTTA
jgi:hypothetical protein